MRCAAAQPTAIFEDPLPIAMMGKVAGTTQPRFPKQDPMMMFGAPRNGTQGRYFAALEFVGGRAD